MTLDVGIPSSNTIIGVNYMENLSTLNLAKQLEEVGYIVVKDFFPKEEVEKACEEIEAAYAADLKERERLKCEKPLYEGELGKSVLTEPTHILLDVYSKSPTLDKMFEKILTDSFSVDLLKKLCGGNIKLRGYNSQKLTGALDEAPKVGSAPNPHEWHRDSPSEFCISIFLTDLDSPNQGATALVPGSHTYPYCPRWNCLFGPPHRIKNGLLLVGNLFLKVNLINKILGKRIKKMATGAYGKRGDFYIFINDMWHGREPNISGQSGIKFMAGAFPLNAPFPDFVPIPSEEILNQLPPTLKLVASHQGDKTASEDSILNRIQRKQKERQKLIFSLARLERKVADTLVENVIKFTGALTLYKAWKGRRQKQ